MLQPRLLNCSARICNSSSTYRTYATAQSTAINPSGNRPQPPFKASSKAADANSTVTPTRYTNNGLLWKYRPRTPGLRWLRQPINTHLHKGGPVKALTYPKVGHAKGGRNNSGKVAMRHRGGGHRRRIRKVDYARLRPGEHEVVRIEYDPNRSAHLALIKPVDRYAAPNTWYVGKRHDIKTVQTEYSYIIAADGMRAGDRFQSYRAGIPKSLIDEMGGVIDPGMLAAKTAFRGNCLPLHLIPVGTQVYNVGITKDGPGKFARSAGSYALITAKEDSGVNPDGTPKPFKYVHIKLQSGETRKVSKDACATIGVASNPHWQFRMLGKAGRSRWLNVRPTVRGMAMNACDHPHGGGRGKSKGNRIPVSPWGTPAKSGYKTRPRRKVHRFLVEEKPRNQGKRRTKAQ